jgi:quercetin dioxygenase-like cupin family protein
MRDVSYAAPAATYQIAALWREPMAKLRKLGFMTAFVATLAVSPAFADGHSGYSAKSHAELEFFPIGDLPIQIAVLWGNPQEGPSAVMMKFPPNFPGGMHTHTYAYHAVVVSGASKHWGNDETEATAALQMPGDYWFQEAGQVHQDSFPTVEETILYLQFEGPIDTMFVE